MSDKEDSHVHLTFGCKDFREHLLCTSDRSDLYKVIINRDAITTQNTKETLAIINKWVENCMNKWRRIDRNLGSVGWNYIGFLSINRHAKCEDDEDEDEVLRFDFNKPDCHTPNIKNMKDWFLK